ncbi:MFS transporter [Streptomyces adustus]|uniref:MFS transporter n=1 Tax=Streptomyces adustus TaxID=1609272 RepID=UPI003715F469
MTNAERAPAVGLDASDNEPEAETPAQLRRARWVLALGSLGAFVVFLDTTIVNIAFQTISRSFDTTTGHLAWVLNAYSLVFAAMLIPAGRIADRYGRKQTFMIGIAGFALMSALCGLAPSAGILIAGRALQAVFAALVVPSSLALVLHEFHAQRRHVAIGVWGAMAAAAAAVGPTLGALLTEYASWRWIFLVNIPIAAIVLGFGKSLLHESRDPHASGIPDVLGTVLIALFPALLSYSIIEGPTRGWSDGLVVAGFVLSALVLPVFLWRTSRAARPIMDLALFKERQFRDVNAATLLFSTAFFGLLLANLIYLQTVWQYSVLRAALASAAGPVVVTIVARSTTKLASVIGHRKVLLAGAVLWTIGCLGFALSVNASHHWVTHWLPWTLLTGLGIGFTLPVQSGAAVAKLPPNQFAVGSAINSSFRQLGAVLGISLFVAILGTPSPATVVDTFHHIWWVFAALGLAAGVVQALPQFRGAAARAGTDLTR